MTATDYIAELNAYCKAGGVSWVQTSDTTTMYKMISRALKMFSRFCYTKWEPKQTLTLVGGTRAYSTSLLWFPQVCMINGSFLMNPQTYSYDPVDVQYLYDNRPTYMTDSQGFQRRGGVLPVGTRFS